jgi:hypothetical protein
MKTFRNLFFLIFSLLVSLTFHSFYQGSDQDKKEQELITKANLYHLKYAQEKIYLHLDRPSYWAGDDIWFKAYLLNTAIPNCNLYIELINSSGDIIDKKISWAQNGLAYGDFQLPDTISSGVYQIRAYTNWMRNFDEEWFFRKDLIIWNLRDKAIKTDNVELKSKDIDLQFFPEGGTFVANLENKLAFKAVDKNGKGILVEGEIMDDKGNKITSFKSVFKGMGNFVFEPQEGRKYTAKAVVANKITIKAELPDPLTDAIKLTINPNDSVKIKVQISSNSNPSGTLKNNEYVILGQSGGQVCFRRSVSLSEKSFSFEIDKKVLPTGIVKFTLFDTEMIPRCERLVFVNHHDFVNIKIESDKPEYLTRELVQLDVKAITKKGIPCLTNLSMSVYNVAAQLKEDEYPNNILTHFLLSSELKGTIENPAWYFKDDSLTTLLALDNLILTHGYREFEWKEILEDQQPEISFQPENSIQLKGHVKNWLSGKPVKDCNVTMMFVKSQLAVHNQKTDSLGNFVFSNLFFMDTVYVTLQAGDNKSRKNNWIDLDYNPSNSPKNSILPVNYQYNNDKQVKTTWYLSEVNVDLINRKWRLTDTILLADINIMANKPVEQTIQLRPYLDADYVFDVTKQDDIYVDIFEMLENTSAYIRNFKLHNPEYFLDGVRVDVGFISGLPANWFEKVEAVRLAPTKRGFGPGLFFYTIRGKTHPRIDDGQGMKSSEIIGYSVFRRFYSPEYETRQPSEKKNDFRSTVYWNPIIRTDSTGVAQVSFYNSDETGNMQVIVEGITADGKLCRGICNYNVKE